MSRGAAVQASEARAWAEKAHFLVQVNPRQALELAERALDAASRERDIEAGVAARHALGWAQYELGDAATARRTLRTGIRIADRHGDRQGAGLLRRHLAYQLLYAGEVRDAQREIKVALGLLTGIERWRSQVHLLEIHRRAHVTDPAVHRRVLAEAAAALRRLRARRDVLWEARLLHNRSALHFDRVELGAAEADLTRARLLFDRLGAHMPSAEVTAALAQVVLLRGEVVRCLELLDEAEARLPSGAVSVAIRDGRYLALIQAQLLPEALQAAESCIVEFRRTGRASFASAVDVDAALINLMMGEADSAQVRSARAARSLAAQGRPVNAALARSVWLRARLASGTVTRSSLASGVAAAEALESAGWKVDALRTRRLLAEAALAMGSLRAAERYLTVAMELSRRGTVIDRVELCHTKALVLLARGDVRRAGRALMAGIELLDQHRSALGALEMRAAASRIGSDLTDLGLRVALASGRSSKVFDWAERQRGNALRLPPVRPPSDPTLRRLQAELRYVAAEIRRAESNGAQAGRAAARQAEIEAKIREVSRRSRGAGAARIGLAGTKEIAGALTGGALVEYVESSGRLLAVTIAEGRTTLHELQPVASVTAENEWLRFALRSLAGGRTAPGQRLAAGANAVASASTLDRALAQPLLETLGDGPLVIVPSGSLHAIPWSALPSFRGRPIAVSPSFSVWLDIGGRPRSRRRRTALVAGPRLRHAAAEVRDLTALHPGATTLAGNKATAEATLEALDGAGLAHIACHGHFRTDSPLFSSLELADGLLNVYELQQLRRAPEVVVLSACDLALSGVEAGNELVGLAAALLGMGTRTIIASVVPASDAAARRMMLDFHRRLVSGAGPAEALAGAQAKSRIPGFVCLGRG